MANFANNPNMLCVPPQWFKAQHLRLEQHNLREVFEKGLCRARNTGDARDLLRAQKYR